jgi:hypothetical protein
MAEVGLALFAGVASEVVQEVLPAYSAKYSEHTVTQPQSVMILCLMRFEHWPAERIGSEAKSYAYTEL